MKKVLSALKIPVLLTLVLMLICGIIYPLAVTGIGQLIFPSQSNGSLVTLDGVTVGSSIVGQDFTDPRFMKCRPSAYSYNTYTAEQKENGEYAGLGSGSQNLAASNPALIERVEADIAAFLEANPAVTKEQIPTDLLTASGSGLDPHISPASATIQLAALSAANGLSEEELQSIVDTHTTKKFLGVFGEETVNVLLVNLDIVKQLSE